jgi:hypothetical protein
VPSFEVDPEPDDINPLSPDRILHPQRIAAVVAEYDRSRVKKKTRLRLPIAPFRRVKVWKLDHDLVRNRCVLLVKQVACEMVPTSHIVSRR